MKILLANKFYYLGRDCTYLLNIENSLSRAMACANMQYPEKYPPHGAVIFKRRQNSRPIIENAEALPAIRHGGGQRNSPNHTTSVLTSYRRQYSCATLARSRSRTEKDKAVRYCSRSQLLSPRHDCPVRRMVLRSTLPDSKHKVLNMAYEKFGA